MPFYDKLLAQVKGPNSGRPSESEDHYLTLKRLILSMAQERSLESLLEMVVKGVGAIPSVALARIYLLAPGDICSNCPQRESCSDQSLCLHVVAGHSKPLKSSRRKIPPLDKDPYRRIPLGAFRVGSAAVSGETLIIDRDDGPDWIVNPEAADREKLVSYICYPLAYPLRTGGTVEFESATLNKAPGSVAGSNSTKIPVSPPREVLGELMVFLREPPQEEGVVLGQVIADHLAAGVANARAFEEIEHLRRRLEGENESLRVEVEAKGTFGEIIGQGSAHRTLIEQIDLVAPTEAMVLVLGESGTGKELVARAIHKRSNRSSKPLITVNCAALPAELYESEFFGHAKGAFSGAVRDRCGRFEAADGGTLFLDEVGEVPPALQAKLLRVLQEGTYERVGEERSRKVDVRIISATNRDLKKEVAAGNFRQDLYYRLNVFPIEVPPLRDRREDIPLLAEHFLEQSCARLRVRSLRLNREHLKQLQEYDWPGNVRELQNVLERAAIMARHTGRLNLGLPREGLLLASPGSRGSRVLTEDEMLQRIRDNTEEALRQSGWRVRGPGGAAELLGIKATTLAARMKAMGLEKPTTSPQ